MYLFDVSGVNFEVCLFGEGLGYLVVVVLNIELMVC